MNLLWIVVGVVAVVGFFAVIGVVKSAIRLIVAVVVGALSALAASWIVQMLGLSESVPDLAILAVGVLGALAILIRR